VWPAVGALAAILIVPWFAWAHVEYGAPLWRSMITDQVYTRFTTSLDPNHLQPWYFYLSAISTWLRDSGVRLLAAAGTLLLFAQAVRRRRPEGVVLGLWLVVPVLAISAGTSKLQHYLYPFLPPLALGAGYMVGLLAALGPAPFDRALNSVAARARARVPRVLAALRRPAVRGALRALAIGALAVAVLTLVVGQLRVDVGDVMLRSSGTFRPAVVAALCLIAAGAQAKGRRAVWLLILASLLPLSQYRQMLARLDDGRKPSNTVFSGSGVNTPLPSAWSCSRSPRPWPGPTTATEA
jgi:4-amino-4-deoxy-L-arabinose transferase-like glycosyltransferase